MTRSDLEHRIDFALTPVRIITCPVGQTGLCTEPAPRYDHQDLIFREPWSSDTYVALSGGSEATQYYLSGNLVEATTALLARWF